MRWYEPRQKTDHDRAMEAAWHRRNAEYLKQYRAEWWSDRMEALRREESLRGAASLLAEMEIRESTCDEWEPQERASEAVVPFRDAERPARPFYGRQQPGWYIEQRTLIEMRHDSAARAPDGMERGRRRWVGRLGRSRTVGAL